MGNKFKGALPLITAIVLLLYVGIGGVIFHFLEQGNETEINTNTRKFTDAFLSKYSIKFPIELKSTQNRYPCVMRDHNLLIAR